jgi:hypothetical protein
MGGIPTHLMLKISGGQQSCGLEDLVRPRPLDLGVGLSRCAADWEERVVAVKGTELNQQARWFKQYCSSYSDWALQRWPWRDVSQP